MDMLIGGAWRPASSGLAEDVTSPFDGAVIGNVPVADVADVRAALDRAEHGAAVWRRTPAFERMNVLIRAAALADERAEQIAQIISAECGKTITEARGEASRSGDLIRLAAFEGSQLYGDTLPLDANRGTGLDKIGFTIHQPVGIVVAITPFNYPALLVLHKLAPALAAGNAVVLKPARTTPLTALALARCFTDAGLPDGVLSAVTGPGAKLGEALAAAAVAAGGFANAGQVCISVQRVITHPAIGADFVDALVPRVEAIRTGDPLAGETTMGTLITSAEAERVEHAIRGAVAAGAKLLTGGERDGAIVSPAVVAEVDPESPFSQDELFGPAVAVSSAEDWESAIAQANGTPFGLGAGIFTADVSGAVRAIREIDAGNVHINWTPLWRADLMPYGGLKASGFGKEGPRAAVAEMTEVKTVVLHGRPW
jgi:acyl-CoA reductase-like NAD-dependent aldehyde dehydrogenase